MKLKRIIIKLLIIFIIIILPVDTFAFNNTKNISNSIDDIIIEEKMTKAYGGRNNSYTFEEVIETSDAGLLAIGYGWSKGSSNNAIIVKYDSDGNQQWSNSLPGTQNDYYNSAIEIDNSFIVVGNSLSQDAGFPSYGNSDGVIAKYDSDGNQQWVKNWGGSKSEFLYSIDKTKDGGFVVAGYSNSTDAGFNNNEGYDAIIIKCDKNGNQQWIKSFGGSDSDYFNSVIELKDGSIIAVGESYSTNAGFNVYGSLDIILVKYTPDGNQQYIKSFGGSSSDFANSVIEVEDESIAIVGYTSSKVENYNNNGGYDAIIIKCDKNGNQQWIKTFGGSDDDYYNSIVSVSDGFIVAGYSESLDAGFTNHSNKYYSDAIILKYDLDGNQKFIKSFGGIYDDCYNSVIEMSNGDFVVVGYIYSDDIEVIVNGNAYISKIAIKSRSEESVKKAELSASLVDIEIARDLVNKLPESLEKDLLQDRLNVILPNLTIEKKSTTSNMDIYIKSENMLSLSMDTNLVTFEDFSGVENMEKLNAVNLIVSSSLPYKINAYLPVEIQNTDKTNVIDKSILNIKANGESEYKTFANLINPVMLLDNQLANNSVVHGIDLMLKGDVAHEKDIYKATVKFEVQQK